MKQTADAFGILACATPDGWIEAVPEHLDELLIDHANCERKAAVTAMGLIHRYPDREQLVFRMSRLAREELRHFEQVVARLKKRGIRYSALGASRYAAGLKALVASDEPTRLLDLLLVGALIEARSWERFSRLVPVVDGELSTFYARLQVSEHRHFEHYLQLAADLQLPPRLFQQRIDLLRRREAELITGPDTVFRFHSGVPS